MTHKKCVITNISYLETKKPIRQPLFKEVQITTTPKANRQKDVFSDSQSGKTLELAKEFQPTSTPISSLARVPQSSVGPSYDRKSVTNSTFPSIQATPTRKLQSVSRSGDFLSVEPVNFALGSSPVAARNLETVQFTPIPDSAVKVSANSLTFNIEETPVKKRPSVAAEPTIPLVSNLEESLNYDGVGDLIKRKKFVPEIVVKDDDLLYKALGWDDDMDELA